MNELETSFLERQNKNALARKLLQEFSAVLKSARLYPPDHPFFVESLRGLQDELEGAFAKENPLVFNLVEKELYLGPVALVENSLAQRQIAKELTSRRIFRLIFRAGNTADELQAFILMLARDAGKSGPEGSLRETLQHHPLPHIDVSFGQPASASFQERRLSAAVAQTRAIQRVCGFFPSSRRTPDLGQLPQSQKSTALHSQFARYFRLRTGLPLFLTSALTLRRLSPDWERLRCPQG